MKTLWLRVFSLNRVTWSLPAESVWLAVDYFCGLKCGTVFFNVMKEICCIVRLNVTSLPVQHCQHTLTHRGSLAFVVALLPPLLGDHRQGGILPHDSCYEKAMWKGLKTMHVSTCLVSPALSHLPGRSHPWGTLLLPSWPAPKGRHATETACHPHHHSIHTHTHTHTHTQTHTHTKQINNIKAHLCPLVVLWILYSTFLL